MLKYLTDLRASFKPYYKWIVLNTYIKKKIELGMDLEF